MLRRIMDSSMRGIERALGVMLIAAIVLNFGNVVGRYLFGEVLLSADELEIFALVFITFFGAGVVAWRGQNLRMDVIRTSMPAWLRRIVRISEGLIGIAVVGFVAYHSWRYVLRVMTLEQKSDMAEIPMWIPHGAVFVGLLLIVLSMIVRDVGTMTTPDAAAHTPAPDAPPSPKEHVL